MMAKKESPANHLARHDRELSKIRNEKLTPVTEKHEGLMQPQDKSDLIHALGLREWIGTKKSVFDLPEGNYETTWNYLTNTPVKANESLSGADAPYCEIDVLKSTTSGGTRKQIKFYSSATGEVWYFNIHESQSGVNDTPRLWRRQPMESILWQGSIQNANSKITLADSLKNYSSVKIGFNALAEPQIIEKNITQFMTLRDDNQTDGQYWIAHYETVLSNDGDKTMTITQASGQFRSSDPSVASKSDSNRITITEIRGVR